MKIRLKNSFLGKKNVFHGGIREASEKNRKGEKRNRETVDHSSLRPKREKKKKGTRRSGKGKKHARELATTGETPSTGRGIYAILRRTASPLLNNNSPRS